ncbi:MAG: PadR family transcriptional regulator [Acidobacteriota bacterium]|nr:PadR family transcriptional regulator [Acidobacteriota bacterium]
MPKLALARIDSFLPLTLPIFHMLLALTEGERHGYALKRAILERTAGKLNLGSGALYGSINKMLEGRLIEESDERPDSHLDDERRRYYRITPLGRRVAEAEALRLRDLLVLAQSHLLLPELG